MIRTLRFGMLVLGVAYSTVLQPTVLCAQSDWSVVAQRANKSVVKIIAFTLYGESTGSGFAMSADGKIATNYHVIEGAVEILVKMPDGKTIGVERVLAFDKRTDLAILQVRDVSLRPLPLGDSGTVKVGQEVCVLGAPLGLEQTFSTGVVSAKRVIEGDEWIQITAPISPGSSGAPVMTRTGTVIGVATWTDKRGQNINFAISVKHLRMLLSKQQDSHPILDRMAQAIGLAKAAQTRTVQVTGTISYPMQGLQGRYEAFYKSPNKILLVLDIQGIGEIQQGFDGKVGWEKNPMTGLRELQGAELVQMRQSAQMGVISDLRKAVCNPKLTGQEKVGNRNAFVITAQTTVGMPIKVYIDAQRYLPLRMDMEVATPQGKLNTTTFLEDYRRVDGVMYPFTIRQSTAGIEAVMKVERVRHNIAINDAVFRKPKN